MRRRVRTLGGCPAHLKNGAPTVDTRVNARKSLGRGEPGQVATVLLHPGAEALPEGPGLGVRERHAVHDDGEATPGPGHDFTSPSTSAACFVTSTVR
jgi:hypothetical protein